MGVRRCRWGRLMSDYKVEMDGDCMSDLYVCFHGPKESAPLPRGRRFPCLRPQAAASQSHKVTTVSPGLLAAPRGPNRRLPSVRDMQLMRRMPAQARTRVECGRCTWRCRRRTRTNHPP